MVPRPGTKAGVAKVNVPGTAAEPPVRAAAARGWPRASWPAAGQVSGPGPAGLTATLTRPVAAV